MRLVCGWPVVKRFEAMQIGTGRRALSIGSARKCLSHHWNLANSDLHGAGRGDRRVLIIQQLQGGGE